MRDTIRLPPGRETIMSPLGLSVGAQDLKEIKVNRLIISALLPNKIGPD